MWSNTLIQVSFAGPEQETPAHLFCINAPSSLQLRKPTRKEKNREQNSWLKI